MLARRCFAATVAPARELFAPVLMLALTPSMGPSGMVNHPEHSGQAGIFTSSLCVALVAANKIEAGGGMINGPRTIDFDRGGRSVCSNTRRR